MANYVTLLNPYFIYFGIHKRLRDNTNFLRGHGWVAQFVINKDAQNAMNESKFAKVFKNSQYQKSSADGVYLCDASAFVESVSGNSRYIFTLVCGKDSYAVREYPEKVLCILTGLLTRVVNIALRLTRAVITPIL